MKHCRLFSGFLACLLLLCLASPAVVRAQPLIMAAPEPAAVTDDTGLLTRQQLQSLNETALRLAETYGCGVYAMLVDDYLAYSLDGSTDIFEVVHRHYHFHQLGRGENRNGVLLMVSTRWREFAFFVYGDGAEYALDDHGQLLLEEAFLDDFGDDRWYDGLADYLAFAEEALQKAAEGEPIRGSLALEHFIVTLIALAVAFFVCLHHYNAMRTARVQTCATEYVAQEGLELTLREDQFQHETVVVVDKTERSGSSSARSGGGGSGRSGRF